MKPYYSIFFLVTSLFFSCEKEDEPIPLNCEIIGTEITSIIFSERAEQTQILQGTGSIFGGGTPVVDGCILEFRDAFFNLDQIVSYRVRNGVLIIQFPE